MNTGRFLLVLAAAFILVLAGVNFWSNSAPKAAPLTNTTRIEPESITVVTQYEEDLGATEAATAEGRQQVAVEEAAAEFEADPQAQPQVDQVELPAVEPQSREQIPDSVFAEEYAGHSAEQLRLERDSVQVRLQDIQAKAYDELYKEGQYWTMQKGSYEHQSFSGVPGGRLYAMRVVPELPDEIVILELPLGRYSHVYDTADRWGWLMRATQ